MIGKNQSQLVPFIVLLCLMFVGLPSQASQSDEEKVGEIAAARILGAAPLVDVLPAQKYLNLVGNTIVQSTESSYRWRFGLIKTDSVNAFATPGGFILVTVGLVKQLENEDELAFVLAHEAAHVLRKHHYRVVLRQRLAETAASNLQAASGDSASTALSQASAQIYARGLDKSSEFDADRLGVELMAKAGYDPAATIGVLERLQKLKGNDPRAELLFSTHPSPAERLDALLNTNMDTLLRPSGDGLTARAIRFRQFLSLF